MGMIFRGKRKLSNLKCHQHLPEEMPTSSKKTQAEQVRHLSPSNRSENRLQKIARAVTNLNNGASLMDRVKNQPTNTTDLPPLKLNSAFFERTAESSEDGENQINMHVTISSPGLLGPKWSMHDNKQKLLQSQFVDMMYNKLFILEVEKPIMENYLDHHKYVTPRQRAILMDWLCSTHMLLRLTQETLQMAMTTIDRYLQVVQNIKITKLQLLGVTSLFIAAKYEEVEPQPITNFICFPHCAFTVKSILKMEAEIFRALNYNLARPVPIHFLRRFSRSIIATNREHTMAKYLEELAVANYALSSYKPSMIAAAALFLSFHYCNQRPNHSCGLLAIYWPPILQKYSTYSTKQIHLLTRRIAVVAIKQRNSEFKAIYKKYSTDKYNRVSDAPTLYGRLAQSIIDCVQIKNGNPTKLYFPKI